MALSKKRIFLCLGGIVLSAMIVLLTRDQSSVLFLVPLVMVDGPLMGITFPFPWALKASYAIALLASVLCVIGGIKHRRKTRGLVAIAVGVVMWALAGVIGLGTGT